MKEYKNIIDLAKENSATALGRDGEYDTGHPLTDYQIHAATLRLLSRTLGLKQAEECLIKPVAIKREDYNPEGVSYQQMLEFDLFDIKDAIEAAQKGTPLFLPYSDGHHWVLIALLPDASKPKGVDVVYVNSIPLAVEEYKKNQNRSAGLDFADVLAKSLDTVKRDLSVDQQYDECCGLSVALNIAKIAEQHRNKEPIEVKPVPATERKAYYKSFGNDVFQHIRGEENERWTVQQRKNKHSSYKSFDSLPAIPESTHAKESWDILKDYVVVKKSKKPPRTKSTKRSETEDMSVEEIVNRLVVNEVFDDKEDVNRLLNTVKYNVEHFGNEPSLLGTVSRMCNKIGALILGEGIEFEKLVDKALDEVYKQHSKQSKHHHK